jgi:serine/threonine protein kinase
VFCPTDGIPLEPSSPSFEADPYLGSVIHGDIELVSIAGVGAMGRVYRAHQRGIDRNVAVKILHRDLSGNTHVSERFTREAKIASKLQHPHVVEVYLAGQLDDGALYIVMEYLDGLSLAAALRAAGGAFPIERALPIALQICDAVGEGHARGIVHRDLKPENIMLIQRGETADWVKVLDFGIARLNLGEQTFETAAGLIFGTARYISPEGAQGSKVGPPGDVYSLAVVLYQMLSGRTPFDAEQAVGLLVKHIHEPPPPLDASIPSSIAEVIVENLSKDPSRRAPTARAFGAALASAARLANVNVADVGVRARMNFVAASPSSGDAAFEITDVALTPTPVTSQPSPAVGDAHQGALSHDAVSIANADASAPLPSVASPRRSGSLLVTVLAFALGVALTVIITQQLATRQDTARLEHIRKARHALANSRYIEPQGDNVRDLVADGLTRWPGDPDLENIRSDAAHEVVTRAIAARSAGDVLGARELAKTALELDRTDRTAKLLVDQYDDEAAASASDAGGQNFGPRVSLEIPGGRVRPGARIELVANIFTGGRDEAVQGAQFIVTGPGLAHEGLILKVTGKAPYRTGFSPPRIGTYDIEFEASVEGATLRAERSLTASY